MKAFWVGILILVVPSSCALGAEAVSKKAPGYLGSNTCKSCHGKQFTTFGTSRHGVKADERTPAAKRGCESCHGPGENHPDDPTVKESIIRFGRGSPATVGAQNAQCLACHTKGKTTLWEGSPHESRGLACTSCHTVHTESGKKQARARALETCIRCHKNVKAQMEASSHHPIREGKVSCTDCHNPHGTTTENLISASHVNEKCYECHAEMRGPFVWQHKPVVESCLNCHKPHGSNHDKLLVRKSPFLCQSCHGKPDHSSRLYALGVNQPGLNVHTASENTADGSGGSRLFGSACNNCHPTVHGSNHPSGKYFTR